MRPASPSVGLGIIAELRRHGSELSPGTVYTVLHGMERGGCLKSSEKLVGRRARRVYRATAAGRRAAA